MSVLSSGPARAQPSARPEVPSVNKKEFQPWERERVHQVFADAAAWYPRRKGYAHTVHAQEPVEGVEAASVTDGNGL